MDGFASKRVREASRAPIFAADINEILGDKSTKDDADQPWRHLRSMASLAWPVGLSAGEPWEFGRHVHAIEVAHVGLWRTALVTVSRTTESSTACRPCRLAGITRWSPSSVPARIGSGQFDAPLQHLQRSLAGAVVVGERCSGASMRPGFAAGCAGARRTPYVRRDRFQTGVPPPIPGARQR